MATDNLLAAGRHLASGPHASKPGSKLNVYSSGSWMSKIVDQMVRRFVLRAMDEGTELPSSAPPLFLKPGKLPRRGVPRFRAATDVPVGRSRWRGGVVVLDAAQVELRPGQRRQHLGRAEDGHRVPRAKG